MRELSPERLALCVENLFERMATMYGSRLFAEMWDGQDLSKVKAAWAEDLALFCWAQIAWALEQCKATHDFPPTLSMFIRLCRQAPRPEALNALPAPDAVRDSIQRVQQVAETAPKRTKAFEYAAPSTDWAFRLRKRFLAGESLYLSQIQAGSKVCGENWIGEGRARRCVPIDEANAA